METRRKAFTLAEVLITFVVVGVVSALTVPQAQLYIRDAQYVNRLKKFYSVANQGFRHRMAQDGVTDIGQSSVCSSINGESTATGNQNNFTVEMMRIFKVISAFNGGEYTGNIDYSAMSDDTRIISSNNNYTLVLADGILMHMDIKGEGEEGIPKDAIRDAGGKLFKVYGTIEVDINGNNGPNRWGYDYYRFVLGQDGFIYPYEGKDYQIWKTGVAVTGNYADCAKGKDSGANGYSCAARIMDNDWSMDYL